MVHDKIKIDGDKSWAVGQLTSKAVATTWKTPDVLQLLKQSLLQKFNPNAL